MEKNSSSAEELKVIRKFMEDSTKFLSLSGFSGVFLGIFGIAGAIIAWFFILNQENYIYDEPVSSLNGTVLWGMIADAIIILLLALAAAFYFSARKAKQSGKPFWTPVSKRLLINLFIPLITGGIFSVILLSRNDIQLIIPVLLIFYGIALINAGKFTYSEIFYLGILEIITGLLCSILPSYGLIFWIIGFGILHIIYGIFMYRKYEL
jgi:hypothetical protein